MEAVPDDMWTPYKQLFKIIEQTLSNPTEKLINNLETCLKKHKQTFTALLKNPQKNVQSRNQIRNYVSEGLPILGNNRTIIISEDLVKECFVVSDMFDLDEFVSLELLCTAQRQMPQHPGLPRGLVAVLLYYDGKKAIASSLRELFQVTNGMSWISETPKEITTIISSFTQYLVEDSHILEKIIDLLDELDITKETVLLTRNRALGPNKHQNQVFELYEDTRLALATSLFNWSAQKGLSKSVVLKLLEHLMKYKSTEASGAIDDVTTTMLMALLYSYDTSILQKQEDSNFIQNLHIIKDPEFALQIYNALICDNTWEHNKGINSIAKFSFGLSLSSLRRAPQYLQMSISKVIDRDEQLIDDSISSNIFKFIYYFILEKSIIYRNEFFYRRVHTLFTDFIDFMHSKVTELRGRADETAKTVISFTKEGLEPPPNLDHNFEMLMLCIGKFYQDNRSGLSLCSEYWGPLDISINYSKSTTRSVSLFKFVRLAGELLPSTLFVPYLKMISGLASCERSARNAFNLLKQSSGLSGSAALSWEHFFGSLTSYYTNLRQEYYTGSDVIYKNRIISRVINPQEIEGLSAVLEIIKSVATYDEVARIALCEHSNWTPLHTLIGLLGCSVPLFLKSEILRTLSALAKSRQTATQLWNYLEAAQIIKTIPTTNAYNSCNLEIEIEQNECRIETYPLTQGILDLLYSLVTTVIPKNLGGGPRKPGFDPYLTFIINGILLKFYNRNYKSSAERWIIGEKCLKLLHYLLEIYEICPKDFDEHHDCNAPPGFHIMLQLQTKSDLLRLILLIIDDARLQLDDYKKFSGKEELEECTLLCLKIIHFGLKYQDVFFDAHSSANSTILLFGLNKILLDVNPRSRRPDHILNTTQFVTYSSWLPNHSLQAIKILHIVSKRPSANLQIIEMFTRNEDIQKKLRQGFVECLECEYIPTESTSVLNSTKTKKRSKIELEIKEAVTRLLQDCIDHPYPNLAHFLLGFEDTKGTQQQEQRLNVIDWNSNCTKSIICLLDNHLEIIKTSTINDLDFERITELSFRLLFTLCSNQRTSDTVLRYLRVKGDFLCRHIIALPLRKAKSFSVLNQMSYLLKCAAIELKVTALSCQLSRFQHICDLFVGISSKSNQKTIPMDFDYYSTHSTSIFGEITSSNNTSKEHGVLLCDLLNCFIFDNEKLSTPKWDFFDNSLTTRILCDCEYKTEEGYKLVNIKKLHSMLNNELKIVNSSIASGQRKIILEEIESILLYAIKVNNERNVNFANIKFIEAWGQVTEILFSCASKTILPNEIKQELIIEILQKILDGVMPLQPTVEISILLSGSLLLLLVNLRYCISTKLSCKAYELIDNAEFENIEMKIPSQKSNALNLKFIFKSILEWIIISGVSSQKLRINLYAALINFLSIIKEPVPQESLELETYEENCLSCLDKYEGNSIKLLDTNEIRMCVEILMSFGDKLMEIVCHDSIVGHDICKMSALACIDVFFDIDSTSRFINFVANRGYLLNIIDSILKSDEDLCNLLHNSENMRCLYVYESKMSMLLRIANTHVGAEILLSYKILEVLSGMKVFDMHPDFRGNKGYENNKDVEFVPTVDARFRQILFPALNLCDCLITTLGSKNLSLTSQVMHFLQSHCDMIEMILRTITPFAELDLLREFAYITSLIANTSNQEIFVTSELDSTAKKEVELYRIQRLVLSALGKFIINNTTFKEMLKPNNNVHEHSNDNKVHHIKYFLEIASNLCIYCRNIVSYHTADYKANQTLFIPNITGFIQRDSANIKDSAIQMNYNTLVVLNQLKGSVEYFHSQKSITESLLRQRASLLNTGFDTNERYKYYELTEQYKEKQTELRLCVFIIEQCLYLLWSHLDYYVRYLVRNEETNIGSEPLHTFGIPANEVTVLLEDFSTLKKTLISTFSETFCKLLYSINDVPTENEKGFNDALLRKIKSLIQCISVS